MIGEPARNQVRAYFERWSPMPFTADDVSEELGLHLRSVQAVLSELVRDGVLMRKPDPDERNGVLYFSLIAERENAA